MKNLKTIISASLVFATGIANAQTLLSSTHGGQTFGPIAVATPVPPGFFPFGGGLSDVVAANVDSEGQLKLIDWSTYEGFLQRNGDAVFTSRQGGEPTSVSAVGLDNGYVITAHVDGSGNLAINTWEIGCSAGIAVCLVNGVLVPGYATTAYPYNPQAVSITAMSPTQVVTAAVSSSNKLAVQVWNINSTTYLPQAAGPAQIYEAVQAVSVAAINSSQVVTAAQNIDGTVELAAFNVGPKTVKRLATASGTSYAVSQVALGADFYGDIFTANVSASGGSLSIVYWTVSPLGSPKTVLTPSKPIDKGTGEHQIAAGWLSSIDFLSYINEGVTGPAVTAMEDTVGDLDVDVWSPTKESSFNPTDDAIDSVALVPLGAIFSIDQNRSVPYFATAGRSSITGDLEIKLWSK